MSNDNDVVRVYFRLHEFECNPDDITLQLNIHPTDSWMKNDLIPNRKGDIRRRHSTWQLRVQEDIEQSMDYDSVDFHLEKLLTQLYSSNVKVLKKLIDKYEAEISVVISDFNGHNPGFSINATNLKKIAELGVDMDFDIYALGE